MDCYIPYESNTQSVTYKTWQKCSYIYHGHELEQLKCALARVAQFDPKRARVPEEAKYPFDLRSVRLRFTMFCGGSVYMPRQALKQAYTLLAKDIEQGQVTFWNEMAYEDEGMRLAVDIDTRKELTLKEVLTFASMLSQTLREYYGNHPIPIFVAQAGPALKIKRDGQFLSTRLHMIAHVAVTYMQARQLLFGYAQRLRETSLDLTLIEIDADIYKNTKTPFVSLRFVYNCKNDRCYQCRGDLHVRSTCLTCQGAGYLTQTTVYEPLLCLSGAEPLPLTALNDAFHEANHASFVQITRNYSINMQDESVERAPTFTKPAMDPSWQVLEPDKKQYHNARVVTNVPPGLKAFLCQRVYENQVMWPKIYVTKLKISTETKRPSAIISVDGIGSSRCPYKGGVHSHSRVFFTIAATNDNRTLFQLKVHCSSSRNPLCKRHKTVTFPVPAALGRRVFGLDPAPSTAAITSHEASLLYAGPVVMQHFLAQPRTLCTRGQSGAPHGNGGKHSMMDNDVQRTNDFYKRYRR